MYIHTGRVTHTSSMGTEAPVLGILPDLPPMYLFIRLFICILYHNL